jgi:hypothetical protein
MRSLVHRVTLAALTAVCASVCLLVLGGGTAQAAAPEAPEVTVEQVKATAATLRGILSPKAVAPAEVGTYQFVYRPSKTGQCEGAGETRVPASPGISFGVEHEEVLEPLNGLTANTQYAVCLSITDPGGTTLSAPVTFATPIPPETPETTAAIGVGTATAKLNGILNPHQAGEAGTYEFLYRRSASECQGSEEKATPADVAKGLSREQVTPEEVTGLLPGSTYTFCLAAHNSAGEAALGNAVSFTTHALAPTVSEASALDVASTSATLTGQLNPGGADTTYTFEYGPTASYGKSVTGDAGAGVEAVTVDVHPQDLEAQTLYHYRFIASNAVQGEVASADQTFTTQPAGASFALPDGRMWEMVSPPSKLGAEVTVGRIGDGGVMQAAENGDAMTYVTTAPITTAAQGDPFEPQVISRRGPDGWVSEDLSTPHNGSSAREFEEARPGSFAPRFSQIGEYVAFSPDLSLAFVQPEANTPLVPGQPPVRRRPEINTTGYLEAYIRDNAAGTYSITKTDAPEWYAQQVALAQGAPSCDASTSPAKGVEVDAISKDGCYVYFNSKAILAPGASGADPLYVSHYEGGAWQTTFIVSLSETGAPEWSGYYVELSPNGRYVAFMSSLSLTGYDNRDANSGERDEEVYLYDASGNHLVCASCNPTGARPVGVFDEGGHGGVLNVISRLIDPLGEWEGHWLAGLLPGWSTEGYPAGSPRIYQPHYVTDDGMLFFDSPDTLVPQDVNGLENVYEYEQDGDGSCATATGCISLISSGTSSKESALADATPNGSDVFFITSSRLTPQDYDNNYDMYDAHVCTASVPCTQALAAPPPCETSDSCKAPPTPQPGSFGAPASATFAGAGNAAATSPTSTVRKKTAKCPQGRRLSRGRCVKKSKTKRKLAKKGRK